MGILGFYTVIYYVAKFSFGGKKKAELPPPVTAAVSSGDGDSIPSLDSPAFDAWVSVPTNLEKYFSTLK